MKIHNWLRGVCRALVLAASGGMVSISSAQSLPPVLGFDSGKQAIAAGEEELKSSEAKRAWLFLEYPQLLLVPEPPAQGTFYSLQKSAQPPLPFLPH